METSSQSTYLTAIFSLFLFRKLKGEVKILILWVYGKVCLVVLELIFTPDLIRPSSMMHLYVPIEFVFFALMFAEATKTYIPKRIYYYAIVVFLAFSVANITFFEPLNTSNSFGRALESVAVVGFCVTYFAQLLAQLKVERLDKDPLFLISCALLLYFTGGLSRFLVVRLVENATEFARLFDKLLYFLNLLCNLVFCLAIWLASKQKQ